MKYNEITVYTNTFGSELVADILYENGSDGVSIYDASDFAELIKNDVIWDYVEPSVLKDDGVVRVSGYFKTENCGTVSEKIKEGLERLAQNAVFSVGSLEFCVGEVEGEDWLNVWKKYYSPIEIGSFAIVPAWLRRAADDKTAVRIDPGMAFGTGEHETTKMCLELMSGLDLKGKRVVDAGCGSGILGIAAALSGADVFAYDVDGQAVEAARSNAALNGVDGLMRIEKASEPKGEADVFIANITADVLIGLSSVLPNFLKKGGIIILSGIIEKRLDQVKESYKGFEPVCERAAGEWRALEYRYGA